MTTMGFAAARVCRTCESDKGLISLNDVANKSIAKKLRACADISVSKWVAEKRFMMEFNKIIVF